MLFNSRSLKNKIPDLHFILSNNYLDVVIITESWLNSTVSDNCIVGGMPFMVFRADRLGREGGGICVFTRTSLMAIPIVLPVNYSHLELCIIDIHLHSNLKIRLFAVYRPPSTARDNNALSYTTDLCNCIEQFYPVNGTAILCGDFN